MNKGVPRGFARLLIVLLFLSLAGCASSVAPVAWQAQGLVWQYPEPPEQPRISFLRHITGISDVRENDGRGQRFFTWLGAEEEIQLPMVSPYGIAADGAGRIWVSDLGSAVVHAIDLSRKRVDYLSVIGQRKLLSPVGAAYSPFAKRLYVSDSVLHEVLIFDTDNRYVSSFKPESGFGRPGGLGIDASGTVYVADVLKGTVEVFSASGEHLRSLGSVLNADGRFNHPSNVAVDAQGRVYVVDSFNFRVEVLGLAGEPAISLGGLGDSAGNFARPRGVAIDSAGHIYVADAAFDNIQIFDRKGTLLLAFGQPGKGPGEFCLPAGLAFDADDRLYVADQCNNQAKIFQYLAE